MVKGAAAKYCLSDLAFSKPQVVLLDGACHERLSYPWLGRNEGMDHYSSPYMSFV